MLFPLFQRGRSAVGRLCHPQEIDVSLFSLHAVVLNEFVGLRDVVERGQRPVVVSQATLPVVDGRVVFTVLIVAVGQRRVQVEHRRAVGLHAQQCQQQDVDALAVALLLHQRCPQMVERPCLRRVVQLHGSSIVVDGLRQQRRVGLGHLLVAHAQRVVGVERRVAQRQQLLVGLAGFGVLLQEKLRVGLLPLHEDVLCVHLLIPLCQQ